MEQFLINYKQSRKAAIAFLKNKFGSLMTSADYAEAVDTAFFKLVLDSKKVNPTLVPADYTIRMLASNALIDLYRRHKREVLTDEYPLSMSTNEEDAALLEKKERLEKLIIETQQLSKHRQTLLEVKFHAKFFDENTALEDMQAFKNCQRSKNLAKTMGYTTSGAFRQESFRTLEVLRSRLRA